ncbi:MAG: hypothetical protein ACKOBW_15875 [Planctomycetota bacterium]
MTGYRISLALIAFIWCFSAELIEALIPAPQLYAQVPAPSELRARLVVNGRTTTAADIPIVKIGQQIPRTYAGDRIANTPGFDFYVSEHFALKSNMDEEYSRNVLRISELAHPHWVAHIGAAPPDPELRMYITFANNTDKLREAMVSDLGQGPAGGFGGGFTAYANRSAYNYPSGTLRYHQRALVMHENLHMLNMICNGTGGTEGPTYAGEQHVFDPARNQLTVFCFDKACVNNYTDSGLAELTKTFIPVQDVARKYWQGGQGIGTMYQQFLLTDPDRLLKWRIWRDQFYLGKVSDESNVKMMESIFGPLDQLNDQWARWIKSQRASFHHVDWGWEQDGNAIWAYGFPWNKQFFSQLDLRYTPAEPVAANPLRMDYPTIARPAIVGTPRRGVEEPTIGFVVAGVGGQAWGGLGLGVSDRSMCQVVIARNQQLVVDGPDLGLNRREFTLDESVKTAALASGGQFGVTITIKRDELSIVVRAGTAAEISEQVVAVPINAEQRERLLRKPLALVGKDGYPRIVPWIDDARPDPEDWNDERPANRWRFAGLEHLESLYRTAWRLGTAAPPALLQLQANMLSCVAGSPDEQASSLFQYEREIGDVLGQVKEAAVSESIRQQALADLVGLFLHPSKVEVDEKSRQAKLQLRVTHRLPDKVQARWRLVDPSPPEQPDANAAAADDNDKDAWSDLPRFQMTPFTIVAPPSEKKEGERYVSRWEFRWRGERFQVEQRH